MKKVVIIPTYNEKDNIKPLIQAIFDLNINDLSIMVIDDNSPDKTAQVVHDLKNQYPKKLEIIERPNKLGLGSAYVVGFKWALQNRADLVFEMDADGSHDPHDLERMIKAAQQADIVIGSRKIKQGRIVGWGIHRHFFSWGAMTTARLILGIKTKDLTAGFRCYHRRVLSSLALDSIKTNGYAFQEEMIWLCEQAGFKIKEIPITFKDRHYGRSKLSTKDILEFFITMIRLRFTKLDKYLN